MKLALAALLILLSACGANHESLDGGMQKPTQREQEILDKPRIEFADVQELALGDKCAKCHHAGGRHSDLSGYDVIMAQPKLVVPGAPEKSELYLMLADGSMPFKGTPLDQATVRIVSRWIAEGADK
jgi:hypothetical protein